MLVTITTLQITIIIIIIIIIIIWFVNRLFLTYNFCIR